MGSLFGGAQTVPTTQQTAQSQSGTSTNQTVANPYALQAGQDVLGMVGGVSGGDPSQVPLLNVLDPNAFINQATGDVANTANTYASWMPQFAATGLLGGSNMMQDASAYFPRAGNLIDQGVNTGMGYIGQGTGLIGQGAGMAQQAGQAITPDDINSFFNPYSSNVMQNLQDVFSQQNTQNLLGSTQASGGTGGERAAVGQALLGQRQGLVTGQTFADLYQRSLQAAEQQKAQQLASAQGVIGAGGAMVGAGGTTGQMGIGAGSAMGGLGTQLGNIGFNLGQLGLGAASANDRANSLALQSGYQLQNLQQAQPNAVYQQQLGQYEDPFRRLGSVGGSLYPMIGLGQTATGATQTQQDALGQAQTTYPASPVLPQLAGLGLAGAALFAARGGRIKKKHKFDMGGAVSSMDSMSGVSGMSGGIPLGTEDIADNTDAGASMMGDTSSMRAEGAPTGGTGSFGGQGDTEADPSMQTAGPNDTPGSEQKAVATQTPEEKNLSKRNQYALMQALLSKSMKGQTQPTAPQITFPPMQSMQTPRPPQRQEGGRVPTPRERPFAIGPKDEETERAAHYKLTPDYAFSRAANPYFSFTPEKNNAQGDMIDPSTKYPMKNAMEMMQPSSEEAPGTYQDGGAVGGEAAPFGGASPSMVQAAMRDDDDDEEMGGEAAPLGGAPQPPATAQAPLGGPRPNPFNQQVTAPGGQGQGFGSGMSPGKLALLQAGLGMMAASGQRDRHGLPMSPLAAVGQGGMQGVQTYTQQQALAQRERAAQENMTLKRLQLQSLEKHRQVLESMPHKIGVDPETYEDIYGVPDPSAPSGFRRIDTKNMGYNAEQGAHAPAQAQVPLRYSSDAPGTQGMNAEVDAQIDKEGDQEYLNKLSPDRRALLQKINRGEYPPPSMGSRSPRNMALLSQLSRAYPDSDLTIWKSRNETRASFSKGVEGRAVSSLDMIAGHLDDYKQTIDNLAKHNVKSFNKIENAVRDQLGGTALADFQTTRAAVSDELARVFQGAGVAAESEKERWLKALDDAKTPAQARAVVHRLTSLIESRMGALAHQYDRGMNYDMRDPRARSNKGWLEGKSKEKFEGVKAWSAGTPKAETSAIPQSYRDWGKRSPENAAKFKEKFGEEP